MIIDAGRVADGGAGRNSGFMIDLPQVVDVVDMRPDPAQVMHQRVRGALQRGHLHYLRKAADGIKTLTTRGNEMTTITEALLTASRPEPSSGK